MPTPDSRAAPHELKFRDPDRARAMVHALGRITAHGRAIAELPLRKFRASIFTAHLMGGCAMSENPKRGVVNSRGRHHQLANLSVMDGSVFPTSIGANPQLSIYGLVAMLSSALARELGGARGATG